MNNDPLKHFMKRGDTGPPLRRTLIDASTGLPVDTTTSTFKFLMNRLNGTSKINAPMLKESPTTSGKVRYDWQTGDTDEAGNFNGEIQETKGSGEIVTYPPGAFETGKSYIDILITDDLGD